MQFLFDRFADAAGQTAFVDRDRRVTYGEVLATIAEQERWLAAAAIERGAVVVVVADYSPEVFCFLMALARRACVAVPVAPTSVIEKDMVLEISEAGWVAEFDDSHGAPRLTRTDARPRNALLLQFLETSHPGIILFSSGSTGRPKAILHDFEQVAEKFRRRGAPVVAIAFLMLDHFGGINTILSITSRPRDRGDRRRSVGRRDLPSHRGAPGRGAADDALVPEPARALRSDGRSSISAR